MSIFSKLWRYVHTYGYPISTSPIVPAASKSSRKRGRGDVRSVRLEPVEQRLLLTTVFGGERFLYTDATGNTMMAQLNGGGLAAELIAAVQSGDGSLLFGDIEGTISATSPVTVRPGAVIGNGSAPVDIITRGNTALQGSAPVLPVGPQGNNIGGLASNALGNTYAMNIFNQNSDGTKFAKDSAGLIEWDVQLLQIDNATGQGTVISDLQFTLEDPGVPPTPPVIDPVTGLPVIDPITGLPSTGDPGRPAQGILPELDGASGGKISGGAFNPVDGLYYFVLEYKPAGTGTTTVDRLITINPSAGDAAAIAASTTIVTSLQNFNGELLVTALTFQSTSATTSTMWTFNSPTGQGTTDGFFGSLEGIPFEQGSGFSNSQFFQTGLPDHFIQGVLQDFQAPGATNPKLLNNVRGLAFLPSTVPNTTGFPATSFGYVFGTVGTGANATLYRIDLNTTLATATNFGSTSDQRELNSKLTSVNTPPIDGQNLVGLTYNPKIVDPFTGQLGGLLSYDAGANSTPARGHNTHDLVFVNDRLRISAGDVYAVYTNQADLTDSITFQGVTVNATTGNITSTLYTGTTTLTTGANLTSNGTAVTLAGTGAGFLGFLGAIVSPNGANLTTGIPYLSGPIKQSLGIYPGGLTQDTNGVNTLYPGLTVGFGLETPAVLGATVDAEAVGSNFTNATGLAIARDGTIAVMHTTIVGSLYQDQLAFIDPTTAKLTAAPPVSVTYTDGGGVTTALTGVQGLAYGSPDLSGTEQLFAVYSVDLGGGVLPTLGTLVAQRDPITQAILSYAFTPISQYLGLTGSAQVEGIAFAPGGTAFDQNHQGLYIVANPNASGSDPTADLYQVDPTTGAIINRDGSGQVVPIGPVADANGVGVTIGGLTFDTNGNLIAFDKLKGNLVDVNLTTGQAGGNISTQIGTITPTVGAISLDPTSGKLFAIDNEDSLPTGGSNAIGSPPILGSAILMQIKDFTKPTNAEVNLGKFLFDGAVTGRVTVSGSMNMFYAGWLITGDAGGGGLYITGQNTDPQGAEFPASTEGLTTGPNFSVGGDIQSLLSFGSMGTNGATANGSLIPKYLTGVNISINGKLGTLNTDGTFSGHIVVGDNTNIPDISDNGLVDGAPQSEIQYWENVLGVVDPTDTGVTANSIVNDFALGQLTNNGIAPFDNTSFNNAQYLGTIRNQVNGQPDVINLDGAVYGAPLNGAIPDPVDYYAVSLMAGQTISMKVLTYIPTGKTGFLGSVQVGIFDPDDVLIATDQSKILPIQASNQDIMFTAQKAGTYRIAIAVPGNDGYSKPSTNDTFNAVLLADLYYNLKVSGVGDLAAGGIVAGGNLLLTGDPTALTGILGVDTSIDATHGDIGAIVAGQAIGGQLGGGSVRPGGATGRAILTITGGEAGFFSNTVGTSAATVLAQTAEDILVRAGNLRTLSALSIGIEPAGTISYAFEPDIAVSGGSIGLIQATGTQLVTTTVNGDTLSATFGTAVGGNIQHMISAENLGGFYRTNGGIGVISAGTFIFGTSLTEFDVNVDRTGSDGDIDLISVTSPTGTFGGFLGGPAIFTGPGGNVRFIHIPNAITATLATGAVFQDTAFGAETSAETLAGLAFGYVIHTPGPVTLNDDSGAHVTITPGQILNPNANLTIGGTLQPATLPGTISTLTYGIRGSGGVVIIGINSSSSVTINNNSANGTAEVGEIDIGGAGQNLSVSATGAPGDPLPPVVVPPGAVAPLLPLLTTLTITGGRVDVWDVTNEGSNFTNSGVTPTGNGTNITLLPTGLTGTPTFGIIDSIVNSTGGDIISMNMDVTAGNVTNVGDVGSITVSKGNIGSTYSTTGQRVSPDSVVLDGTFYPFNHQGTAIITGNIGLVSAGKSIGNIIAIKLTSAIGTITANTLGNEDPSIFYGINGPIEVNGTITPPGVTIANGTQTVVVTPPPIPVGLNAALPVSISRVDIGNGILSSGSGNVSNAGIYASGQIISVTGTGTPGDGSDIRGSIISGSSIGSITLTNGSIINANIVVSRFLPPLGPIVAGSSNVWAAYINGRSYDTDYALFAPAASLLSFDNPFFEIGKITISGNGGIIGSTFNAHDIANITVNSGGFGILNSQFGTESTGVIGVLSAAGYGIRGVTISTGSLRGLIATGNGSSIPLTAFSPGVRPSAPTNRSAGAASVNFLPNALDDLAVAINGNSEVQFDGSSINEPDPSGTTTGVIENILATGGNNLGPVTAFELVGSTITFANSTGAINITRDIIPYVVFDPSLGLDISATGTEITSGSLVSLNVGRNVTELDLEIAGKIGPIVIGGNLSVFTDPFGVVVTGQSLIIAKGPSGDIGNITIRGNVGVGAVIESQGALASLIVGSPNLNGPSTGDFSGTLIVQGDHPVPTVLGLLEIFGSIIGGNFDIIGNVGTINIAHSLNTDLVIHGNLATLLVGTDPRQDGDTMGGTFSVEGNLGNFTMTGSITGDLLVRGNAASIAVTADAATSGTNLIDTNAAIDIQGTLTSLTVSGGDVAGSVVTGKTIAKATITGGSLVSGGEITSSLGNITSLTVGGDVGGSVTAPNGTIVGLLVNGKLLTGSQVEAKNITTVTTTGTDQGSIVVTNGLTTANLGSIAVGAMIQAGWLGGVKTAGDSLGNISATTNGPKATTVTVGGNLGGTNSFPGAVSITVAGNVNAGTKIIDTGALTSLKVGGALSGDVSVNGQIGAISAGSVTNAVITAGFGITSLLTKGAVSNSLIQAGIAPGNDGVFGTNDLGEEARMADITSLSVGSLSNTIIAAGGNIGTFKSAGSSINSSVSAGLVLGGSKVATVISDASPLATTGEMNTARSNATLFHGSAGAVSVGGSGLVNSSFTAGIAPGVDGAFGTADDSIASSLTGGASAFKSIKAAVDGTSHVLAANASTGVTGVNYTLDGSSSSIIVSDPLGTLAGTATTTVPFTYSDGLGHTLTITIKGGTGSTVKVYGSGNNPTLVVDGSAATVTVTTSAVGTLNIGRLLTTHGTTLASFISNAYLAGDGNTGPQLWIDSAVKTFTVAGFATNGTTSNAAWSGQIGGDVGVLTVGTEGPGKLRIGGRITTLSIAHNIGNALFQQLGTSTIAGITQLATSVGGVTYAYVGGTLFSVNVNTGVPTSVGVTVKTPSNQSVSITGLDFNGSGTLYGVGTLNNQSPTIPVGNDNSGGDQLHGMAVDGSGNVYAINNDPNTGLDQLVTLDKTTGQFVVVGTLKDAFGNTYSLGVSAMTFGADGTLYAIVNDRDGNGTTSSSANGAALVKISTTAVGGIVKVTNPSSTANALDGTFILRSGSPVTDTYTGLVALPPVAGHVTTFYAVRNVGGVDILDQLVITNPTTPNFLTVAATTIGSIKVGANNTATVGIGFDENGNLIGLDENAVNGNGDLVEINTTTPGSSKYLTAPGTIPNSLKGFAIGSSGTNFKTYAYTTDISIGGTLYVNPGVVATLGTIAPATGLFTQLSALTQDATNTPLAGNVASIAVNKTTGNVFVVTDTGVLAEYSGTDGSLIGPGPIGVIVDGATGEPVHITHIAFDGSGNLIGIDSNNNRLDLISTTTSTEILDGVTINIATAAALTDVGTVPASDFGGLSFDATTGSFFGLSKSTNTFIRLTGTNTASLGGITANTIGALNITGAGFTGRVDATGIGSKTSIDSIKITGSGFAGDITTAGSIGALTSVTNFDGTVRAAVDFTSAVISGNMLGNGTIAAGGTLGSVTVTGTLFGSILATNATKLTIGAIDLTGNINIKQNTGAIAITGADAGTVTLNNATSVKVGGLLTSTATFKVHGDAGSVTLSGGTADGSKFLVDQGISGALVVGGTLSGTISTRRSVGTVTLAAMTNGLLTVGGDITSLSVNGAVFESLISSGVWVGFDGTYNTDDDIIYGGSITTAKFGGTFTDSAITAGVLAAQLTAAGPSNDIPADNRAFSGNAGAANVINIAPAEAGGIWVSSIGTLTFAKGVNSTNVNNGNLSVVVTTDGVGKITGGLNAVQATLANPSGALDVATDSTGTPLVSFTSNSQIEVVFNKPVATSTLTSQNIFVTDVDGNPLTGLTFHYLTRLGPDGLTEQFVLQIVDASGFPSTAIVDLVGGTGITDPTGIRSSLLDFDQNGTPDANGNPFAPPATFPGTPYVVTKP